MFQQGGFYNIGISRPYFMPSKVSIGKSQTQKRRKFQYTCNKHIGHQTYVD